MNRTELEEMIDALLPSEEADLLVIDLLYLDVLEPPMIALPSMGATLARRWGTTG